MFKEGRGGGVSGVVRSAESLLAHLKLILHCALTDWNLNKNFKKERGKKGDARGLPFTSTFIKKENAFSEAGRLPHRFS